MRHQDGTDRRLLSPVAERNRPVDEVHTPREVRRIRIENWRIIYVVSDDEAVVDVLGVRKRPPYDYADLEKLLDQL